MPYLAAHRPTIMNSGARQPRDKEHWGCVWASSADPLWRAALLKAEKADSETP